MSVPPLDRKLLAILAADVVGFSKAMEADEAGTIARLKASRTELVDPLIAQHHGRIVKLMGDGALVAFDSVVDAVVCAAEIQKAAAARNAGLPEPERLVFRMGINLQSSWGREAVEPDG
jgi:class 3 adenylate cyclase